MIADQQEAHIDALTTPQTSLERPLLYPRYVEDHDDY
jgi:hypothetical protein